MLCMHDLTGFMTESIKEIMKEIADMGEKKVEVKGLKIWILETFKS